MKRFLCAALLLCGAASVSLAAELPEILRHYRVGQGFNVHYEGNVLVYEGKIDGEYGKYIFLLYQEDLNVGYRIAPYFDYRWHGNIYAELDCIDGAHVSVLFEYYDYDYYSGNRTYYWNIPLDYYDEAGNVFPVTLAIRTEQHENFGSGCSAGVFTPLALLLLLPLILRRGSNMKKVFGIALFALAVFALPAFAEIIEFPSVKITLDIEPGWTYEDNGEGTATIYILEKSSMTISRVDPEGMSLEQCAEELSQMVNGTKPLTINGIYYYHFNDDKTTVYVTPSDGGKEVVVVGMTPGSPEDLEAMQRMLKTSKDI